MTVESGENQAERRVRIETICLRLLARREHSKRQLLDKLAMRGFERDEVAAVIDDLSRQSWQDDARYAECYIRDRIAKGYGPIRIAYELQQRGIVGADLDVQAESRGGWLNLSLEVYAGKFGDEKSLTPREWAKRSRFLQQRGFAGDTIKQVFAELKIKLSRVDADSGFAN
ncbi:MULTISPECIES: regulatory protein RecX [Methylomonas]|uniref:regulatory protein RecX n=1 Tax=Methylomonas TaxID=416 RepID=UPI001231CC97|nr:regulatory protein RecX [Methylomonas rhizoryzae]